MGSSLMVPRANILSGKLKPDGGGNWLHFFVSCLLFQFPETDWRRPKIQSPTGLTFSHTAVTMLIYKILHLSTQI